MQRSRKAENGRDSDPKDVSIIIVNWNGRDYLANCLWSLQKTSEALSYELYVVDNASSDGSCDMLRHTFPTVRLIENRENLGFSRANNLAIRQSNARYVLLLNSDTLVFPDTLQRMVHFMDAHPRAGITGCQLLNPDGSWQPSTSRFPTPSNLILSKVEAALRHCTIRSQDRPAITSRQVDMTTGACMIVRREAIAEVGLLDENIFLYLEDTDWCYRMLRAGWQVMFTPCTKAIHFLGGSLQNLKTSPYRQKYEYCRNQIYFYRKHYTQNDLRMYRLLRACWFLPLYGKLAVRRILARASNPEDEFYWVGRILRELIFTTTGMQTFGKSHYWTP